MSGLGRVFGNSKPPQVASPFRRARGTDYVDFFAALHSTCAFDWYLEVGCRTGQIFAMAPGKTIAVDPYFQVDRNVIGPKPALHIFQETSDDFFASGFLPRNDIRMSVSFLDGMHLVEYLLRDFIHTEAQSRAEGVILLHDCSPHTHAMTVRDFTGMEGRSWTGDVWKLLPILAEHRPDLKVQVFDCAPTGLVAVTNLDPSNRVLHERYDDIVRQYQEITLADFGVERFFDSFAHVDAAAEVTAGFPTFRPVTLDPATLRRPEKSSP